MPCNSYRSFVPALLSRSWSGRLQFLCDSSALFSVLSNAIPWLGTFVGYCEWSDFAWFFHYFITKYFVIAKEEEEEVVIGSGQTRITT